MQVRSSASFALSGFFPTARNDCGWCIEGESQNYLRTQGDREVSPSSTSSSRLPLCPLFSSRPDLAVHFAMLFHAQLLISTLLAVSSVLGAPNVKRDDADPCKGLGTGAYSNLTNFRVASLHSGRNKNEYGSQVILATTGVISGASSRTFRVSATHPSSS